MNADAYLVVGLVLFALTIPSMLSAFTEGRAPKVAMALVIVAGVLIVLAVARKPGGYAWHEVPGVFTRVIGSVMD